MTGVSRCQVGGMHPSHPLLLPRPIFVLAVLTLTGTTTIITTTGLPATATHPGNDALQVHSMDQYLDDPEDGAFPAKQLSLSSATQQSPVNEYLPGTAHEIDAGILDDSSRESIPHFFYVNYPKSLLALSDSYDADGEAPGGPRPARQVFRPLRDGRELDPLTEALVACQNCAGKHVAVDGFKVKRVPNESSVSHREPESIDKARLSIENYADISRTKSPRDDMNGHLDALLINVNRHSNPESMNDPDDGKLSSETLRAIIKTFVPLWSRSVDSKKEIILKSLLDQDPIFGYVRLSFNDRRLHSKQRALPASRRGESDKLVVGEPFKGILTPKRSGLSDMREEMRVETPNPKQISNIRKRVRQIYNPFTPAIARHRALRREERERDLDKAMKVLWALYRILKEKSARIKKEMSLAP